MDPVLVETGDGGDLILNGRDLALYQGFGNMPYLALFGGNIEASTSDGRVEGEQAFDYWGNTIFWPENEELQFNSITERTLKQVALNSAGRIEIENAVLQDLDFLRQYVNISVEVRIISDDRVQIIILLTELANANQRRFVFVFDPNLGEVVFVPLSGDYSREDYSALDYFV